MKDNKVKDYKYKMDKIERYFSFLIFAIFIVTFNGRMGFYIFTAFTIIVFAYYFIVYKNRPPYVSIKEDEIAVSRGMLFKIKTFKVIDIAEVKNLGNKIELSFKEGQKITLMKILLSDDDYNDIFNALTRRISGDFNK